MKRGYHQRTPQRQQNAEREPRNSNYYGGYYVPAVPSAGGGYAGSYFAPSAYSAPAAGGQMPLYHVSHPSSLHGFTPHPHGFDDVRSSAIHQLPDRDAKERPSDSSDESETGDPMSVCRDRKSGLRKMVPVLPMYENEARKLPPLMFSEVSSMPTCLPPMALETPRSKAEKAAKVAYERLLTEKRGVTVWKLVQSMLTQLNWDSLEASGLSLHDIPSLQKLTVLEGKINTYIHCHVAVRRITTLHELSQEISENEGVKDFDDLKLGPLSYHPLVCQYFAFPAGVQVCKISTEDVLSHLSNYMNTHLGNIQLDDFLSFMSKARSLPSPQHLGVRLQSLGMYISFIRREKKVEKAFASQRASLVSAKETTLKQERTGPSITSRIDAFLASAAAEHGQHTLLSSDNEVLSKATTKTPADKKKSALCSSQLQPNSCPYPSAAEERVRLCTKSPADSTQKTPYDLSKQELGDFVAAWRGFIQKSSVSDVLMQILANGSSTKQKRKLLRLFKQYPAIGILNIAVVSMKAGHWNSLYDAFEEAVSADATDAKVLNAVEAVDRMEILSEQPHPSRLSHEDPGTDSVGPSMNALNKVLLMLENMCEPEACTGNSTEEDFDVILKRLIECEKVLLEQLIPKCLNSNSEDSSDFIEQYLDKVSRVLIKFQQKKSESYFNFYLPENRVKNFLHQLAMATDNFEGLSENTILQLLAKQFHLDDSQWYLNVVKRYLQCLPIMEGASSLFYSHALLSIKTERLVTGPREMTLESREGDGIKSTARVGLLGNLTSIDARNCLLKAPMLCNILEWSQWDAVFSPTLGPLLDWLERQNLDREFVCLVTCQGSILRIDGSATVETLLAAAVRGLGKETALQLISLVAVYGGADKVPRALLKSHFSKAIELLIDIESLGDKKRKNPSVVHETVHNTKRIKHLLSEGAPPLSGMNHGSVDNFNVDMHFDKFSRAVKFVLELFMHLPSEFVTFVAPVVVPALCGIVPSAPLAMLKFCSSYEHKMRLHEVGLASGMAEWVRDFQLSFAASNCPVKKEITNVCLSSKCKNHLIELAPTHSKVGLSSDVSKKAEFADCNVAITSTATNSGQEGNLKSPSNLGPDDEEWIEGKQEREASEVISLIRKEEFGMDLELTTKEHNLLAKQHARMGRALRCLSRELYSQDSHYVLELVQNADDNQYAADVAAMLVFVLQHDKVVVVNNELGFTPSNMKALCDVGNSTKTGSAAGYIGQKGIGFKSVFRITDSPEIHSKGFHVKFDVSEGNIGFVLPTKIPPFGDWHKIEEVLSLIESLSKCGKQTWNTCMVLPLKHTFRNGPDIEILSTKLGDVHPSLLLFLRRLCCITIKDDMRGTVKVMQRSDMEDGLVRVSDNERVSHWLVVKQQLDAVVDRPGVKTTEIALAFPLHEVSPGRYEACNEYQQVFAFLPLRSYGLKFIVQGDFVLPSSREDLDTDSPWNQWLLSEIPTVCVRAVEAFKQLSCFKEVAAKAASMFLSFLPHEGEVQGFFSSLPRMIFMNLRACSCLPIEGENGEWALPCILLGRWNDSVRALLPDELLWELLGLRYLHREVHLSSILAAELGIHLYGSQLLVNFLESLCSKKDALAKLGPRWVSSLLVALHRCGFIESQRRADLTEFEVADHDFKRLRALPFIPLSNGTYTSVEDGPLWLPSVDATSATRSTGLLREFPLLYSELRMVDAQLLLPHCTDNSDVESFKNDMLAGGSEERVQIYSVLKRLGIGEISEHNVVTLHVLPSMTSVNTKNKSDLLLMQCLAFAMVHLQSDCSHCITERPTLLDDLRKNAIILTSKGRKRVNEAPLHFGLEFGCPVDVSKILQGLPISWTEVEAAYLQAFQGWPKEVALVKWRSFFNELGVADFVKLELVEKNLDDKATSIWRDISWEGFDDGGTLVTIRDWECPEAVQILESLCSPSFDLPERPLQCAQILSLFDVMWEESYCDCAATYWIPSSPGAPCKATTIPSFILWLRSFPWIQSSFDGKMYYPKELFHQCSAVEPLLGNNAPYAKPQVKSTKLAVALGLQTVVTAPLMLHVLKLWNQMPIRVSMEQMTKLYTCLWNEMKEDKDLQQFLRTESSIFVPEDAPQKPNETVAGQLVHPKAVVWRDETGCLSLMMSNDTPSKERPLYRTLNTLYPALQPFFVNGCHIRDTLCFKEYYGILQIVARTFNPRKVLDKVLKVFAMWSDSIDSGSVSSTDLLDWKELLWKADSKVFPTVQNKWVSLHCEDGILCWCDDEALGKMFLGSKGIHFMCVDMAASDTCFKGSGETVNVKVLSPFLQAMNIFPLSKVVKREAIPYGAQRSNYLMELFKWAVPYVQRYLQKLHPNIYKTLQNTGFNDKLNKFTCLVCSQLFFRYKLPGDVCNTSGRLECNYLLEGDVFYADQIDDLNGLFLEFSKLFFDRVSNVQLANFLHLITLSVQSGSKETEIESLLASQGIDSYLESDAKWTFLFSDCETLPEPATKSIEPFVTEMASGKARRFFRDTWPPRSLQHAVSNISYRSPHAHRLAACQKSLDSIMKEIEVKKGHRHQRGITEASNSKTETAGAESMVSGEGTSAVLVPRDDLGGQVTFSDREQLARGQPNEQHQELTGRLGEAVVYNHLLEKHGPEQVTWMNADVESGLPYDIVLKGDDGQQKLMEVKTTWSEDKDWFEMSPHEWELACRLGDRFVIVRVFLAGGSSARFLWLPDPPQLCQQRLIKLALVLPRHNDGHGL